MDSKNFIFIDTNLLLKIFWNNDLKIEFLSGLDFLLSNQYIVLFPRQCEYEFIKNVTNRNPSAVQGDKSKKIKSRLIGRYLRLLKLRI